MKISKKLIALLGAAILLSSCSSSKNVEPVPNDTYSDGNGDTPTSEKIERQPASTQQNEKKKSSSIGESITNGITNFFSSKFVEYDKTSLFAAGTFGGIKQQNAIVVVYPKDGSAGFGSPIMAAYYYLTFDADGRKKLEKAVNQYLSDFENKKLDRKSKKSYKAYGTVKSKLYWGTVKTSSPNRGADDIYLGYKFEKNSPYFTLFMYPTTNEMYTGPDSTLSEKSITVTYYFTKAQAQALVECLSDENVYNALNYYEVETYGIPVEEDEYFDDDSADEMDRTVDDSIFDEASDDVKASVSEEADDDKEDSEVSE